jgi:ATP-binding cassette subfamily C protein CydD
VSLALPGRRALFEGLSLEAAAGEKLVIYGPSGCGKSTLLAIIGGFLAPDAGDVVLDEAGAAEVGVAGLTRRQLSELRGYLGQQPFLYAGTIRDNITLGTPAEPGALERATALAGLEAFLATLPAGLDTRLGQDGLGVSGGQARRIALARVLLKPRPLLLLDEPTASLDADTERQFWSDLDRALAQQPMTVICASHSPLALAWADRSVELGTVPTSELGTVPNPEAGA